MELRWWWLGLLLVGLAAVVVAYAWLRPVRAERAPADAVRAAHSDRVQQIPLYRRLARRHLRRLAAQVVCAAIALTGAVLVAARLAQPDPQQLRNRDIMLCLDVSGSMQKVDALVVDSYLSLVARLDNERIGFTMFDASAVTVFPLTRDQAYISQQLQRARTGLAAADPAVVVGTREGGAGSSLVGDGLASCTQRFDRAVDDRPRVVVFATDNVVNGEPIYPLPQAIDLARERRIMVFAIAPDVDKPVELGALRDQVRRTGGDLLRVRPGEATDVSAITVAVEAQQRQLLEDAGDPALADQPWPGALLLGAGLLGSLWLASSGRASSGRASSRRERGHP